MIIGTLPVVIAVSSNLRDTKRDGRLPWLQLLPSLGLIAAGISLVNHVEIGHLQATGDADLPRYLTGAVLALGAVACWTWYPIRNADWLRAHPDRPPSTWATAQGVATLPLALLGYGLYWVWSVFTRDTSMMTSLGPMNLPLGPRPLVFLGLMFTIGLFASWLGTLCWNEASQRLPTTVVGQLIVFETLSALAYAFVLRGTMPAPLTLLGAALLVAGVVSALRIKPAPLSAEAHPN
jgi:drug/metabolite transporter (DMT)-like permease